jgi:hypothetical protein
VAAALYRNTEVRANVLCTLRQSSPPPLSLISEVYRLMRQQVRSHNGLDFYHIKMWGKQVYQDFAAVKWNTLIEGLFRFKRSNWQKILWFYLDITSSTKYTALIFKIGVYFAHEDGSYKFHNERNLPTIGQLLISVPRKDWFFSFTSVQKGKEWVGHCSYPYKFYTMKYYLLPFVCEMYKFSADWLSSSSSSSSFASAFL